MNDIAAQGAIGKNSAYDGGRLAARGFVQRMSIKKKLIVIILFLTLFGLIIIFAGMTINNRIIFGKGMRKDMTVLADIIGNNSRAALTFNDPQTAAEILAASRANNHIVHAVLFDAAGKKFTEYIRERDTVRLPSSSAEDDIGIFSNSHMTVTRDIFLNERRIGRINLTTDMAEWNDSLRNYVIVFVLLTALTVAITLPLAFSLQRIITAPINNLVETAREVSRDKNYSIRVTKTSADELGVLVDGFNGMLAEIQHRDAELRDSHYSLERRVAERTSQLDTLNKELEAFSYSVSHDLRAPLRHIMGFVELLSGKAPEFLDAKSRHYLQVISDSARQMGHLIDDLLSFSRMGRSEMMKTQISLDALVKEVINGFQEETKGRDIVWKVGPLPEVNGDSAMLRLVFVNLISNALKYTRPRQQAIIEIGCSPGGQDENVFYIKDNGVGFDMQYADKLFGLFQRLHRSEEFEGTGLGLANIRRIVLRHGGRVWAEGAENIGAIFYFSLPAALNAEDRDGINKNKGGVFYDGT